MVEAYLGLGGNLGNREANLRHAVQGLRETPGITVTGISSLYETPPWGPIQQGPYLNACLAIETTLSARTLLARFMQLEVAARRERLIRWGPRTLDIDLLVYGNETIDEFGLIVPHPRMMLRSFVLVPLAEIAPDLVVEGKRITDRIKELDDRDIVKVGPLGG